MYFDGTVCAQCACTLQDLCYRRRAGLRGFGSSFDDRLFPTILPGTPPSRPEATWVAFSCAGFLFALINQMRIFQRGLISFHLPGFLISYSFFGLIIFFVLFSSRGTSRRSAYQDTTAKYQNLIINNILYM